MEGKGKGRGGTLGRGGRGWVALLLMCWWAFDGVSEFLRGVRLIRCRAVIVGGVDVDVDVAVVGCMRYLGGMYGGYDEAGVPSGGMWDGMGPPRFRD